MRGNTLPFADRHKLGQASGLHFLHHPAVMRFNGQFSRAQLMSCLLFRLAPNSKHEIPAVRVGLTLQGGLPEHRIRALPEGPSSDPPELAQSPEGARQILRLNQKIIGLHSHAHVDSP